MGGAKPVAVFLGPSLPRSEATAILDADYHPPVRQGDLYRILTSGVKTVVIIDGLFNSVPSVWHREILDAMAEGVCIIGASSMGALRAAELHTFGMIGHGTVFEWYRDGVIDGDDEVALVHGDEESGFRAQSEPLVNIRYTLGRAVEDGCLSAERADALVAYAKELYYPHRSYDELLASPVVREWGSGQAAVLKDYLTRCRIDLKRRDAAVALREARHPAVAGLTLAADVATMGVPWRRQARQLTSGCAGEWGLATVGEAVDEVIGDRRFLASLWRPLAQRSFLLEWAEQNGVSCPDEYVTAFADRWCQARSAADGEWMLRNGLTPSLCRVLLAERALVEWIVEQGPSAFGLPCSTHPALHDGIPTTESRTCSPTASTRSILVSWARQNGVACPEPRVDEQVEDWKKRRGIDCLATWCRERDLDEPSIRRALEEEATAAWMAYRGPAYFGLHWSLEGALASELQITGMVAQVLARRAQQLA